MPLIHIHEGYELGKWVSRGLLQAQLVATYSKDPSTQVGCYIETPNHRPVAHGFNGFPPGIADDDRLHVREEKLELVVHAEMNAIHNRTRSPEGCTLYTWPIGPCVRCAVSIISEGVKNVVFPDIPHPRFQESVDKGVRAFLEADLNVFVVAPSLVPRLHYTQ